MKFPFVPSVVSKVRHLSRPCLRVACGLALGLGALSSAQAAPPDNDNFAGRFQLTGTAAVGTGNSVEATRESFEPNATGNKTLWWTWTAPADGTVTINLQGTTMQNPRVVVFNGSQIDQLDLIDSADDSSSLVFPTVAGAAYQISVGNYYNSNGGNVVLNIKLGPSTVTSPVVVGAPANTNDNFDARVVLAGTAVSGIGYSRDATRESFEPTTTGNKTLWWTWTAPADGTVTINLQGTTMQNPRVVVFNGDAPEQLTRVNSADDSSSLVFPTVAGAAYQISVGNYYNSNGGNVVLNVLLGAKTITSPTVVQPVANTNDNFGNRTTLSGTLVSGIGHPLDATRENLESNNNGNNTLWWTWTAPSAGVLTVSTKGTTFNHVFVVYTGNAIESLTTVTGYRGTAASPASTFFAVEPGATYQIAVGAQSSTGATSVLNLSLASHPTFFNGEVALPNEVYYLNLPNGTPFGYYSYQYYPYLYHFDLGFLYFFDANDNQGGTYLYDFASRDFYYTSPSFPFPYLYDFGLRSVLYYFPDTTNPGHYTTNPRYFYNYATGRTITK